MKFPPSVEQIKITQSIFTELIGSIQRVEYLSAELEKHLEQEHVAIDRDLRHEYHSLLEKANALAFRLNVQLARVKETTPERVIVSWDS